MKGQRLAHILVRTSLRKLRERILDGYPPDFINAALRLEQKIKADRSSPKPEQGPTPRPRFSLLLHRNTTENSNAPENAHSGVYVDDMEVDNINKDVMEAAPEAADIYV